MQDPDILEEPDEMMRRLYAVRKKINTAIKHMTSAQRLDYFNYLKTHPLK